MGQALPEIFGGGGMHNGIYVDFALTDKPKKSYKGGAGSGNFGHAGRPGEIGGSGEGGPAAAEAVPKVSKVTQELMNQVATIGFEGKKPEPKPSNVDLSDPDSVMAAMDPSERRQIERNLEGTKDDYVESNMNEWDEPSFEDLLDELDAEEIAKDAGYSEEQIHEDLTTVIHDNMSFGTNEEKADGVFLLGALDDWKRTEGGYGENGVADAIREIENTGKLSVRLQGSLSDYEHSAQDAIQEQQDSKFSDLRDSKRDDARTGYEEAWEMDMKDEEKQRLVDEFLEENPDRFQDESEPDPPAAPATAEAPAAESPLAGTGGSWYGDGYGGAYGGGGGTQRFDVSTSDGRKFEITAYGRSISGKSNVDIQFRDTDDGFGKTGKGGGTEVFGKVIPPIVALIKHDNPDTVTFSAMFEDANHKYPGNSEYDAKSGESRARLYSYLAANLLRLEPDRFAISWDDSMHRSYLIGRTADRVKIMEYVTAQVNSAGPAYAGSIHEIKPRKAADTFSGFSGAGASSIQEIKAEIRPEWYTKAFWRKWEREHGKVTFDNGPLDGSGREKKEYDPNQPRDEGGRWTDGGGDSSSPGDSGPKNEPRSRMQLAIRSEPVTPTPGIPHSPDVHADHNGDGVTDSARVGVPADEVPPPPPIPRIPNLTPHEREAEESFASAYEKNSDEMAKQFRDDAISHAKPGEPPTFGTDDAKVLFGAWNGKRKDGSDMAPEERADVRATLNVALHQTANAIAKNAFLKHLDTLKAGDEILVTVGGCGAGKGYALSQVPEAVAMKVASKAVWDSAGDQNATENVWIQKEAEKRGLVANYVYISSDPHIHWADPKMGVVARAGNPKDGRMVDSHVFADSYAIGAKNHEAFHESNKDNRSARFSFLMNEYGKAADGSTTTKITKVDSVPERDLSIDRNELLSFAESTVSSAPGVPARTQRGALIGDRIWPND